MGDPRDVLSRRGKQRRRWPSRPLAVAATITIVALVVLGLSMLITSGPSAGPKAAAISTPTTPSATSAPPSPTPTASIVASASPTLAPGVLPVATTSPNSGGMDALWISTLEGGTYPGGACFWLETEDSVRVALQWPYGFTARRDPLRLIGGDGQVLAKRGDHVELGGGSFPGYIPTPEQDPCKTGGLYVVSAVVSVNGVRLDVYSGSLRLDIRAPGASGFCRATPRQELMLGKLDGRLQVQIMSTGEWVPATWPDGFAAKWGNRVTIRNGAGDIVMTQGVETPSVRARVTTDRVDICGFGDVIYE